MWRMLTFNLILEQYGVNDDFTMMAIEYYCNVTGDQRFNPFYMLDADF